MILFSPELSVFVSIDSQQEYMWDFQSMRESNAWLIKEPKCSKNFLPALTQIKVIRSQLQLFPHFCFQYPHLNQAVLINFVQICNYVFSSYKFFFIFKSAPQS